MASNFSRKFLNQVRAVPWEPCIRSAGRASAQQQQQQQQPPPAKKVKSRENRAPVPRLEKESQSPFGPPSSPRIRTQISHFRTSILGKLQPSMARGVEASLYLISITDITGDERCKKRGFLETRGRRRCKKK